MPTKHSRRSYRVTLFWYRRYSIIETWLRSKYYIYYICHIQCTLLFEKPRLIVSVPTKFDLRGCSFQFQQHNATMLQKHLKIKQVEKWKKDKLKKIFTDLHLCTLWYMLIITDSDVLWKIQKFDWLISETKWHSWLHNRALCSYLATLRLLRQRENNQQFPRTY